MTVESSHISRRRFLHSLGLAVPAIAGLPLISAGSSTQRPALSAPDLRFIARELPLRRRHEWARVQPNPERLREATADGYNRITLHHAGTDVIRFTSESSVVSCLDGVLGGHLQRRFGDVGYHFLIDYAGRVWEGRSLAYWGAHVSGHNEHNVGIVLLGNFEKQRASRAQIQSMQKLVGLVRDHYAIRPGAIYGHIDLGRTLCPGRYLYPQVQRLNQLA